jgi:hypothetical protein
VAAGPRILRRAFDHAQRVERNFQIYGGVGSWFRGCRDKVSFLQSPLAIVSRVRFRCQTSSTASRVPRRSSVGGSGIKFPSTTNRVLDIHGGKAVREPLVSVVIPVFNRASVVANAIRSVSGQTFQELEMVVVDDGSLDATAETVLRIAQSEPRIRLIRHQANRGAQDAHNTGCSWRVDCLLRLR